MEPDPHSPHSSKAAHDVELVRVALAGNSEAWTRLEARLLSVPRFLAVINRRHGSAFAAHDLEDLAQDTLVRIWKKLDTFAGRGTLETWMFRFSLLEYMNRLRRKDRDPGLLADEPVASTSGSTEPEMGRDELLKSLAQIPDRESEVIELRHFEELTFHEIADRLDVPLNTARTRYYRGLKRLRGKLTRAGGEDLT